jgi:hypothetical protein
VSTTLVAGRPGLRLSGAALGGAGLVVLLAGTFLPWLSSGRAHRNSYQAGGSLRRLLRLPGVLDAVATAWPFAGLLCAAVVATFALGLHRCAAALALFAGLAMGAVAVTAMRVDGNSFVRPLTLGPAVTILGAAIVVVAATLVLTSTRRRPTLSRSQT